MKTFKDMSAQGDFVIIRKELYERFYGKGSFPDFSTLEKVTPHKGKVTVAHSETGHDHVMTMEHSTAYKKKDIKEVDLYELFFSVKAPETIEHLRSFDTHETIQVPAGDFIIKRQRESSPEGFRRASD